MLIAEMKFKIKALSKERLNLANNLLVGIESATLSAEGDKRF